MAKQVYRFEIHRRKVGKIPRLHVELVGPGGEVVYISKLLTRKFNAKKNIVGVKRAVSEAEVWDYTVERGPFRVL